MQLRTHVFYNLKMIQNLFGFGQKSIVIGRFHDPIMTPYRIKKVKIPVNTYITFSAQDSTINIWVFLAYESNLTIDPLPVDCNKLNICTCRVVKQFTFSIISTL